MFLTMYSLICAVRMLAGGSKVIKADASLTNAVGLRGANGRSLVIPAGGLFRISSIIANINGPGPTKISLAASLGVITESKAVLVKVVSSKCDIDEPASNIGGVKILGFMPLFALIPKGPDQTSGEVKASPNSLEGVGKSINLRSSIVCKYASNGVGLASVPTPKKVSYEPFDE
ncbi:MAG: hypothetical protein F2611_03060, partial [Actinobacteria bacterium]|nr:hypothetical protein [Actinomycetota bacterium]